MLNPEGPIDPPLKWRPIPGHPGYMAGTGGSILSSWQAKGKEWRELRPSLRKEDGRKRYTVRRADGRYRRCYGATLVLEAFIGPCPPGMECCHNNGDCTDDSLGNLRWDTPTANKADMERHGTRQRGEQINTAKLTEDDVRAILAGGYPLRPHAEKHGVSIALVGMILRRKVWKHVI